MATKARLGAKVRALRRTHNLRQAKLAEMLRISPSYLNLIEHDRRPLSATLLIRLTEVFDLDLRDFAADADGRVLADLMEVFGDPALDTHGLRTDDVRELAVGMPAVAKAVVHLYQRYRQVHDSAVGMATRLAPDAVSSVDPSRPAGEEVSDFLQNRSNYFPALEDAATALWREAGLRPDDMYHGLSRYLRDAHDVRVRYVRPDADRGAVRRFDPGSRELVLSEALPRSSRKFQIAHQIALVSHTAELDRILEGATDLTTPESIAVGRIALANYFAGAVVMPYRRFLETAVDCRYDLDLLGNRFGASFEQVCHRLTTLRRPGAEGVSFHFVRVDIAGNISKRFSASGIQISRFGGACPRWNLHLAFLTPGHVSTQLSVMPDGQAFFCVARTVAKGARGYHAPKSVQAITLGCDARQARALVYADGVDLDNHEAAVPIGTTCRLCPRTDCEQRAFPQLSRPRTIDENVRGVSFYAPVEAIEEAD